MRVSKYIDQNIKIVSSKGFTLIELLVVIAIIGILASVILSSLNSARDKGSDAAVKMNVKGLPAQAGVYYDDAGMIYTNFCQSQQAIDAMSAAQTAVAGTPTLGGLGDGECIDTATTWAAWVNLKDASTTAFCVDSEGKSVAIAVQDSSVVDLDACP